MGKYTEFCQRMWLDGLERYLPKNLMVRFLKFIFVITPKPLFSVPLFWIATIGPILVASYFAFPLSEGLVFDRSRNGYEIFVSTFEFPLWVASGSILFGVMVGRFHGSVQRHENIIQAEKNNSFKNYLEHRKSFLELMPSGTYLLQYTVNKDDDSSENKEATIYIDSDRLYLNLYPFNSMDNFNPMLWKFSEVSPDITRDRAEGDPTLIIIHKSGIKIQTSKSRFIYAEDFDDLKLLFTIQLCVMHRVNSISLKEPPSSARNTSIAHNTHNIVRFEKKADKD